MFLKRKRTQPPPVTTTTTSETVTVRTRATNRPTVPASTIEFRDPPPAPKRPDVEITRGGKVADFLREIAFRKGEWAVYRSGLTPNAASSYVSIYRKKFPHSEWVARRDLDGMYTVFVRVLYI